MTIKNITRIINMYIAEDGEQFTELDTRNAIIAAVYSVIALFGACCLPIA